MKAAILLTAGFEDAEAVIVYDILSRLNIVVDMISCTEKRTVTSYFGLTLLTRITLGDIGDFLYDAIIIPGGPEATKSMAKNRQALSFIEQHDVAGKWLCALCSAAPRVLADNQLLKGRAYTCSGDLWQGRTEGRYRDNDIVVDGNLITGRGLGVAFDFAFTVAEYLSGSAVAGQQQAEHIYHQRKSM